MSGSVPRSLGLRMIVLPAYIHTMASVPSLELAPLNVKFLSTTHGAPALANFTLLPMLRLLARALAIRPHGVALNAGHLTQRVTALSTGQSIVPATASRRASLHP